MDWLFYLLFVDLLLHLLNLQLPLIESLLDLSLKNVVHDLFFHLIIVLFPQKLILLEPDHVLFCPNLFVFE